MLTFIAPILTGFSGPIFLKEPLSLTGILAGCKRAQPSQILAAVANDEMLVCSFFGVILIARPEFLFGSPEGDPFKAVMPEKRMLSVA